MTLQTDDKERIMNMGLEEAYKLLVAEAIDKPEFDEIIDAARWGIIIEFDIYLYFTRNYNKKERTGNIVIAQQLMTLHDFWTELEEREAIIKRNLLGLIDDEEIVHPRLYKTQETIKREQTIGA